MKRTFRPELLNGSTGDPLVLVRVRWSGRRLLLDLGDAHRLVTADALRVTDVFLSHTHMDHFVGFDHLLRLHLGRETRLRLWGPEGTAEKVGRRLGGYTWNLVDDYRFALEVRDVAARRTAGVRYRAVTGFEPEPLESSIAPDGWVLQEDALRVRAVELDHGIPVLGWRLEEPERLNVDAAALQRAGLRPGPWVGEMKRRVRAAEDEESPLDMDTAEGTARSTTLAEAAERFLRRGPGHVLAYATDFGFTDANRDRVIELARDADPLICEATYRDTELEEARKRHHLTARQAGEIAAAAGAPSLLLTHFSPRYHGVEEALVAEAAAVYDGPISYL